MQDKMHEKKLYIWRLAHFLQTHGKVMSGKELAEHLNRNGFRTSTCAKFRGRRRGIFKLVRETWNWLDEMGLPSEAKMVAHAIVDESGKPAWKLKGVNRRTDGLQTVRG